MNSVHPFERAGLGVAPFRFVGMFSDFGPHFCEMNGVRVEVGAHGQPMGTCDYCGQGIGYCFTIRSADGREFVVGSDCVAKTSDPGAPLGFETAVAREARKALREQRHARERRQVEEGREFVSANREALAAIPSPSGRGSLLDRVEWLLENAGTAGRLRAIREARGGMAK